MSPEELVTTVANWAQHDDRVVAAGLCGSYARGEARPDSDIDFCIVCTDPDLLVEDRSWIYEFAKTARVAESVEDYKLVRSVRVFYGDTEAEFGITDPSWMELPLDGETARIVDAGLRILYDPVGGLEQAVAYAAAMCQRQLSS